MLRYSCAIPAFNLIDNLSSLEMHGLADMFEGWAQSDLTGSTWPDYMGGQMGFEV